jgi:hypothetical protein
VPASGGGGPVIGERSATAQSLRARGLRRVTLLVPESCAKGLQDLARGLRAQQGRRTAVAPLGWRRLSPSTELMVDPRLGARCAIRDTRVAGAERYYWTMTVIGEPDPVAAGRTADIAAARAQAEATLGASADERERLGRKEGANA